MIILFIFIAIIVYLLWPTKSVMAQLTEEIVASNL